MLNSNKKSALNKAPSKIVSKEISKGVMVFFAFVFVLNSLGGDISPVAKAAVPDTSGVYDQSGNLNIGKCMKQGSIDFGVFLRSTLWSDTFIESVVEPWRDVLIRNACQAFDLYGLVMQQDKIRKQIRAAFLTCRNDKVPKLKEAYYKTTVEINFARNVVYGGIFVKQYKDMDVLLADMKKKYVDKNSWFTKEQFAIFGNELKVRYADRVSAYVDKCDQGSWAEVRRKFEEFYEQVIKGGFVEDIKKGAVELKRKAKDVKKAFGDAKSWEEWGKGLLQVNLSGTPCSIEDPSGCKDFWKDFTDELDENNPFTKTNFPSTTQGLFEMKTLTDMVVRQRVLKNEMSTRFQMLYGAAADTTLQEFINASEMLNTEIKDSFAPLNKIKECAKAIGKKQCK